MVLDDASAGGEPDADAIVFDRYLKRVRLAFFSIDAGDQPPVGMPEFQRIADQVLEELHELRFETIERRQIVDLDGGACLFDQAGQVGVRVIDG